jgi:hypothetical protein
MTTASELDETLRNRTADDLDEIGGGSSAAVRRGVLSRLAASLTAPVALVIMLVWGNPSQAIPPDGPPPPPDCAADITGHLTATPTSIDRETSANPATTLTWSVVVPKGCPVATTVSLGDSTVQRSGRMTVSVTKTRTFALVLTNLHRTLASVRIDVAGDPGFITVSPGRQVTADDIAKFNQQWMQPFERQQALDFATSTLQNRDPDGVWGTGERMAAMVRMYELTFDKRYLDHLREFIQVALKFRDDLPLDGPDSIRPVDQIRNKAGIPGWGGSTVESGGLHRVEEIVSSLYAYPIAAFARIVAENPSLQAVYGDDAIDYANRVFETVAFFLPQIRTERVGDFIEARLTPPEEVRNRPTEVDCTNAYNEAMSKDPNNVSRWNQQRSDCNLLRDGAGRDLPHNINLTYSMMLIELSRVLDTNFYQQSPKHSIAAEVGRDVILRTVIRQQRYFANHLNPGDLLLDCLGIVCWHYMDNLPANHNPHPEDLDHGSMDMSYVDVFLRNYGRLELAAQRFSEPLAPPDWQAFARTFVRNTEGTNFQHDVAGAGEPPPYVANSRCEGWLTLTRAAVRVYQACHDVSLRIVDGGQPYLNIGNHSSLLANKQFSPQQ